MLAGIMLSAVLLTACSSEEKTVQENAKTVEFNKSAEMLSFESSLKEWMQAKRETAAEQAVTNKQAETNIARDAEALLTTIGISPEMKKDATTDELVRFTMRAYSKKLTEIYQQQMK